ncbi:MAG: glycosyltransferase family 4 protein [Patescibacteria group bacterium]
MKNSMSINFLLPHLRISGGVKIALTYANLLKKRGHKVRIYVQSNNPIRRTVANIFHLGYPHWIEHFQTQVVRVPSLEARYLADADVTVVTTSQTALLADNFPPSKGRQFYLLQHDEGLYHVDRDIANRAYETKAKKVVVSTWLKEILKKEHGQEAMLLLNPIDLKQFYKVSKKIKSETVRVMLLHHVYEWKGTAEGVEVIQKLKRKYPHVRLVLFGVRQKSDILFPYDEYHFNVPQHKLAELYSSADIYLCPSWDEGFGLPSIEAMACGLALVTYDNGGSRDYAFHNKTALVAERRNTDDLYHQLECVVTDHELRHRIAEEGKVFVESMEGWNQRVKEFEEIISSTV